MGRTTNNSKILVSGYPRSGNVFLRFAISEMYGENSVHKERSHSIKDIELYPDKNICVVIRDPLKAISSWNHFRTQIKFKEERNLTLDSDFNFYIRYYSNIGRFMDRLLIMNFDYFTVDSGYIVENINKAFKLSNSSYYDSDVLKDKMAIRGGINHLPRKSNKTRDKIEDSVLNHKQYNDALDIFNFLKETCA